ncbi:MAG: helix-turn-helix domain-containing protein [Rhodospirillales bacterium]|nr:helix-turn-helix domain-containing protein [Rhodospirillales bacterium]
MSKAFKNIMAGMEDALAFTESNPHRAKAHKIEVVDVKAVREKTGLSQAKFAAVFLIPVGTLRGWEQGRRKPEGPAIALLQIIDKEPATAIRALHA